MAEHSNQITLAARLDAQHTKSVLLVMERDPLDEAGQDLCGRTWRRSLSHGHPPNVRKCAAWTSPICGRPSTVESRPIIGRNCAVVLRTVFTILENRGELRRREVPVASS